MSKHKHLGIERHKKLKDEMKAFPILVNIHKGKNVEVKKRKKRAVETKKREMVEKKVERESIIYIRSLGFNAYKTGETSMYNSHYCEKGVGDITIKGKPFKIIYIEMKKVKEKQRDSQIKAQKRCEEEGIGYYVIEANKIEEAKPLIINAITMEIKKSLEVTL